MNQTSIKMQQFTIHIVRDSLVIEYLMNEDLEGFSQAISDGLLPNIGVESFNSEAEALAFCAGLGNGSDERAVPGIYPLRSFEPVDVPYIKILEEFC